MLQRTFILHPKKLDKSHVYDFDFQFKEINFPTEDGLVNAIHAKTENESKGVVLYFHGNADNLKRWGKVSSDFLDRDYDVIMLDYRGFGKSDGKATEENMYEDALAMYHYALEYYDTDELFIYGRSIGSGVASALAARVEAKKLLLETPFYSLPDVVKEKYPFVLLVFRLDFHFPNHEHLETLDMPVHIFHGTKDKVVPYESAEKLRKYLKHYDSFLTIPGGGHKDLPTFSVYQSRLTEILG